MTRFHSPQCRGGAGNRGVVWRDWLFAVPVMVAILTGHAEKSPPFEGDLFAGMPEQKNSASSFEEDVQRAQQASHWVRIVFEAESHPKFAELVVKRLKERWNPNLGFEMVFGESRGAREKEGTSGTIRISIKTYSSNMQYENRPETERFIWAVELIARKERYDLATSWDDLHISAEKRLPQRFALAPDRVEAFNRAQMGQIYADFKKALEAAPEFSVFPGPDFDLVRPLFTYRGTHAAPSLSPAGVRPGGHSRF